ncbi:DUF6049 family protein [Demequina sp. SO4-13]|uniref:DUF6049 family protein n=1 Tax=Demequina sp. SO4-13 TaxID=3401027 RepID=UPI003AF972D2
MKHGFAAIAAGVAMLLAAAPAAAGALPSDLVAHAADAGASSARSTPTAVDQQSVTTQLVALASGALDPSSRMSATVTATNRSTMDVEDAVLELALTERPLADRAALDAFLADPSSVESRLAAQEPESPVDQVSSPVATGGVSSEVEGADSASEAVGSTIAAGASRTFTIGASPDELGLPSGRWGVWGAVLTLRTPAGDVFVDAIPLTWQGAEVPQLDLSVLTLAEGTESSAATVLGAANIPGVASAVDPTLVTNAVAFDAGLVERETWRLASGSPDLTSLARAEQTSLMELALSLPAATNLASIGRARWLAVPAAIDATSTEAAAALGARATLALPDAAGYAELADTADAALVQDDDALVLVPDAGLTDALSQYRPGTEAAEARAIAESALLAEEVDGDPVLAVLADTWRPSSAEPSAVLEALMTAPWVQPLPVSDLLDTDPVDVELPANLATEADLPAEDVAALVGTLEDLTTLAHATTDPDAALADWGAELLGAAEVSLRDNPGVRDAAIAAALAQAETTLASLRIAESSDLNLLAETGEIPVTVVNDLDHEVRVRVDLTSFSPNLQVLEDPTITVPANEEQAALVRVEAVSSDNVSVSVALRSTEGAPVGEGQTFAVRVRADWGNAATAVFSVVLVLLLVAGLVRTARRGRRDTRAEPAPAPATAPDPEAENSDPFDEEPTDPGDAADPGGPERTARD